MPLLNRMSKKKSVKLHFLGTGTAIVTKYVNSSFLLESDQGLFLVDGTGGAEILKIFERNDFNWKDLKAAYISHEHTDHILGMVWVVRMIAFLINLNQYQDEFFVFGNDVTIKKLLKICQMILQRSEVSLLQKKIHLIPVQDHEELSIFSYDFEFYDIQSTKAVQYGFQMTYDDGKRLVFMGDEPYRGNAEELLNECDWLISEAYCLYQEREKFTPYKYHHSTVRDAAQIAENYKVKNLILWHTEDSTDPSLRKKIYSIEASKFFSGNIFVPDDGETLFI